jgi:uncharacterized membrane protein
MSTKEDSDATLEDFTVPVKLKLAALWTSLMFCYVYGDIFTLQEPGHLNRLIAGTLWNGGPLTQGLLLSFAIGMVIPSVMVFLSLALKPIVSRWTNIVVASLVTVGPLLTVVGAWYYYVFLSVVETILTLLIIWYAWKWPRQVSV